MACRIGAGISDGSRDKAHPSMPRAGAGDQFSGAVEQRVIQIPLEGQRRGCASALMELENSG